MKETWIILYWTKEDDDMDAASPSGRKEMSFPQGHSCEEVEETLNQVRQFQNRIYDVSVK